MQSLCGKPRGENPVAYRKLSGAPRCAQKLTALQLAHCVVRSFPYYPDIPAIVLWVAAAENDAGAVSLLQHAARRAPADDPAS